MVFHIFSHTKRLLTSLVLAAAAMVLAPSAAWAQSACGALYGIVDNDGTGAGTVASLRYFNTITSQWVNLGNLNGGVGATNGLNALAGSSVTGLLYYVNRTTRELRSINTNTSPFTEVSITSALTAPPNVSATTNILGATTDLAGNLFLLALAPTSAAFTNNFAYIAQVNPATGGLTIPWTTATLTTAGAPVLGGSGDIYCDSTNACFYVSNTAPQPTRYALNLTAGASFAQLTSPSVAITGADNFQIGGVAVNPATQIVYVSGTSTFSLAGVAATSVNSTDLVVDMGNCFPAPAVPSVSKSISQPYSAASPGTATIVLTLGNVNTTSIYLFSAFSDVLPAGMVVASPTNLSSSCSSALGTPTTSIGSTSVTFAAGGKIPAGGCSISFAVSATASVSAYTNTIPAGALVTSAGNSLNTATAVFKVGTDFSAVKSQCQGVCGVTTTSAISTYGGQTLQYVLSITNSTLGGTGTVSFTDTLPTLVTPVLSISAAATGGGTCTTASAVVGGATQITGVFGNAPAGAQCNITVVALVNPQAVGTTVTNTLTIAPTTGTVDTNAANNTAAVLTNVGPSTVLTVTKTNGVTSLLAGSTTSYTVTVANLGPANAPNSVVTDPAVPGLSCTAVACPVGSITGTASCPTTLTIPLLQSTGLVIPTFNASSSVTFVVTCNVTATGQ